MIIQPRTNCWLGCTTAAIADFPYDQDNPFVQKRLAELRAQLKTLQVDIRHKHHGYCRSVLGVLCSQQMKAKAILEEAGFTCIKETRSGHPEEPESDHCNGGTIYLMWKEY